MDEARTTGTPPDSADKNGGGTERRKKPKRVAFDAHSRALIKRFLKQWVFPRWKELAVALAMTACLAAVTGGYPMIIKLSFDTLMKSNGGDNVLLWVLAAVIGVTAARSVFLYLQTVATNRIVWRMSTDMQKTAFSHLVEGRLRPPDARNTGPPRLAADERHKFHTAGRTSVVADGHSRYADGDRTCRLDDLP